MARRTAKKGKRRAKTTRARKPRVGKAKSNTRRKSYRVGATTARKQSGKRIAQLEAENSRLREDLEKLRAELGERAAPGDDEPGERTLPLDL